MYDIAVIGLGPAGSFLVKHLNKKYSVIAIDKKSPEENGDENGGFHKPCGGLLAPDAQKSLSCFNLTLPKDILVSPQIFSVRAIDVNTALIRHYQRFYINMDRHKFDLWLMSQIPDHVDFRGQSVCVGIKREESGFRIDFTERGQSRTVYSRYIVGADGAASVVRRELFPDERVRAYLSIQQWFVDTHSNPFYSCVFDSSLTDSYAWGLTKDERFIFGGAFSIETGKQDFEKLKEKTRPYGFHLEDPIKTEACLVLCPGEPGSFCCGRDGAFLVGEAAGFISPSSLEGISYAIDSAYLLSRCFDDGRADPNREYREKTRRIRLKLYSKCLKRAVLYNQTCRKLIMKSGLMSVPILA